MSNYENFGEPPKTQRKSALEDFSSCHREKGYKTFDEGFFKFENNTIEFIYCIERNNSVSLDQKSDMTRSYNLQNQVITKHGTSFWTSVLRLLLLTSGIPVFMIPNVFISAGYLTGSVLLIIVVCFYVHTMRMVLWSAEEISKLNHDSDVVYSDLLYEALKMDRPWEWQWLHSFVRALSICVFSLTWYSVCIFVYLLTAENVQTICNKWFYCDLTVEETLVILILPAMVLSLISKAMYLESIAAFGFFCNLISLILVVWYVLVDSAPWMLGDANGSFRKPLYIGILLINVSVTPAILLIKSETKNTKKFDTPGGVVSVGYFVILVIYLTYSLICGLKYGNDVPLNTITILHSGNIISQICPIFYGIGLACVYPHLYCGLLDLISRDIFQEKLKYKSGRLKFSIRGFKIFGVLTCFLLAYLRPSLFLYLSFGGTVCTSVDSIVYPALVHTIVYWKMNKCTLKFIFILIKNLVILAVGLYLAVIGVQDCIWFVNHDE